MDNTNKNVGCILEENGSYRYFDMNGVELKEGDFIQVHGGQLLRELYRTEDGCLGIDATNPRWVETGRAVPCEYGIYPLEVDDMMIITKVE